MPLKTRNIKKGNVPRHHASKPKQKSKTAAKRPATKKRKAQRATDNSASEDGNSGEDTENPQSSEEETRKRKRAKRRCVAPNSDIEVDKEVDDGVPEKQVEEVDVNSSDEQQV